MSEMEEPVRLCWDHAFNFPSGITSIKVQVNFRTNSVLGDKMRKMLCERKTNLIKVDIDLFTSWLLGSYLWYLLRIDSSSKPFLTRFLAWLTLELLKVYVGFGCSNDTVYIQKINETCLLTLDLNSEIARGRTLKIKGRTHLLPIKINMEADRRWSSYLFPYYIQRMCLEYIMACLSTLGGAHSSLGENSKLHAKLAGRISLKQLRVAIRLQDPLLASRCRIFLAQSYMQQRQYKKAEEIIKNEFKFAVSPVAKCDSKLLACCQAASSRLRYLLSLETAS